MAPPARRLIRRRPLRERIASALSPMDFLLWLSEELETREWDSKAVGTKVGFGISFVFLLALANAGKSRDVDDVFGEASGSEWASFFAHSTVWTLALVSVANAGYTMLRVRNYRLFEARLDQLPETPSARRVKVQSETASSSPLRFLNSMISPDTAESRAHPDKTRDVWELSVWDPLPICLRLFCLFSPGHVLVYILFLPIAPLDPHPSMTAFKCIVLQLIMSAQLLVLQSRFAQQAKDSAIIHKEVLHEYDTKYVHPRLHPVVRDASTQVETTSTETDAELEVTLSCTTGTPTTLIRRGFQTHPNPNYTKLVDPNNSYPNRSSPRVFTPVAKQEDTPPSVHKIRVSHRQSLPVSISPSTVSVDVARASISGGNMGVHNHVNSPLKKAISMGEMNAEFASSPKNSREMAALEQRGWARESSPVKSNDNGRSAAAGTVSPAINYFNRGARHQAERYPSRWA